MRKQIAAVAVAALLVFAGCSAGGDGGATTAPETNGATADGEPVYDSPLDAATVAENHESVVRDAGTFTLTTTLTQSQGDRSSTRESSTALNVDSGAYFSNRTVGTRNVQQFGYGNGTAFQRVTAGGQTQYMVLQQSPNVSQLTSAQLSLFVGLFNFSHAGTESVDGTETDVYEASGVEDLNESAPGFAGLDVENVSSIDAHVRITDEGLVKQFGYSLTLSTGSSEASVSTDQRYVDVGSTSVSEPAWLDDARENTSA
ncbi:hypothetical protein [Halobacterium sp. CBA1126]|uniref:DUF7537 family lipoprotein n=1 Tax=Halobacterium TaxID=2239 RepID=UPI0012F93F37|nr:hypothetical protein [Halobacterium sp. CBA1126]MUV59858.1 hypothetical protein [Halobacterium sp. CBA1126]